MPRLRVEQVELVRKDDRNSTEPCPEVGVAGNVAGDGRAEARGAAQSTFGSEAANTAEFYEEWMVKNEKRPI